MKKFLLFIALSFYSINYSQSKVARWNSFNTSTASYPRLATEVNNNVSAANLNFSNCILENDSRTVIAPSITPTFNADTSPYIEFNLTLSGIVDFDRFVLPGIGINGSNIYTLSLRWNIDNYASSLGTFILNNNGYSRSSVDLNALNSVGASNVTFRIYFYGGTSTTTAYFFVYGNNYSSPDNTPLIYASNTGSDFNVGSFIIFGNSILANEKFDDNTAFKIFPNPSNGIYTISADANTTVEIFDLVGKSILVQKNNMGQTTLNLSQYTAGMYLAKITNQNNETKIVKLIKQ